VVEEQENGAGPAALYPSVARLINILYNSSDNNISTPSSTQSLLGRYKLETLEYISRLYSSSIEPHTPRCTTGYFTHFTMTKPQPQNPSGEQAPPSLKEQAPPSLKEQAPPSLQEQEPPSIKVQEIEMATALMSIAGPCRIVGDIYLSCVATAGLGQCRSLRAQFEQCGIQSAPESRVMLGKFSKKACAQIDDDQDQMQCGAQMVMKQVLLAGQAESS
jgi:hypothetical protein